MASEKSIPNREIPFSLGTGDNLGKAQNITESLAKFATRYKKPTVTTEKRHEYLKLSDQRQRYLKGVGGWYMRAPVESGTRNRNSIRPGAILTLDIDYATPEFMEDLLAGKLIPGTYFFAHTTRSHTPEKPRCRIIIPVKGSVTADRYQAASRITAKLIDPDMVFVDKVSFRVAQMMYMPTVSSDMLKHYVFYEQSGKLLDHEKEIGLWEATNGSAENLGALPRAAGEEDLREHAEKAEDPLLKEGPVGNWCRAYSVSELVLGKDGEPGLLADVYEPVEYADDGSISRMTFIHGSTSNGAVVYDDKFIFSHHGSDPAQDQLLNAYDLTRVHLFGDKDKGMDADTPMSQRPSVKALNDMIVKDVHYKQEVVASKYDLNEMFNDDDDDSWVGEADEDDMVAQLVGTPTVQSHESAEEDEMISELLGVPVASVVDPSVSRYQRMQAPKPPKTWVSSELELDKDGQAKSTLHNIAAIVLNDPRFFRKIAFNEFSSQVVLLSDIKTKSAVVTPIVCEDKENGSLWQDNYDLSIRAVIEGPNGPGKPGYGFKVADRDMNGGIRLASRANSFHPIKEYLESVHAKYAGTKLMDTFFIRHLGVPDNAYTRQTARMILIAAVARIFEPGCKFDYAPIIEGKQGIGKSTAVKLLFGERYFGEIDVDLKDRKQVAEQIAGKWGLELPELSSLHKTGHNDAKHFMRRTDDDVRLSYDRTVTQLRRQCVFFGTTNDKKYLRDPTGNRSYWPLQAEVDAIDFAAIIRERDAIWGEAVHEYRAWRERFPLSRGDLPLTLTGEALRIATTLQEKARKKEMHEDWIDKIADWLDSPVMLREVLIEQRRNSEVFDQFEGHDPEEVMVKRVAFSQETAFTEALKFNQETIADNIRQMTWNAVLEEFERRGWMKKRVRVGGHPMNWIIDPTASATDLSRGFIYVPPEGHAESDSAVDDLI